MPQTPELAAAATNRLSTVLARVLLLAWVPCLVFVLATLMTGHWVTLPTPAVGAPGLQTAIAALAVGEPAAPAAWTVCHVLYSGCHCSRRVFDHLQTADRPAGVREIVLLVGDDDVAMQNACTARGMRCVRLDRDQLQARFGIEAAPLFVVADPRGVPLYIGGYTDHKQGLDYRDAAIVDGLRRGDTVAALPVYGCGVSQPLQAVLDPLGLKY